jgi:hypothetical protein
MSGPRVQRRRDVLWRRALDAVVLLPPGHTDPVTLAGSGPDVWALLVKPTSVGEIASRLARRYGVAPAVIERDLEPVLDRLLALAVIVPA